jgi:membrane protein implicated in regulation of membrane protease activity
MDLASSTLWWIAAGIAVAAELATGTFYLLMVALGLAAGAVAALLGLAVAIQVLAAAVIGGGATAVWHWRRLQHPAAPPTATNRDINLDIGARVHVKAWDADGNARVSYRGSEWNARLAPGAPALHGEHRIVAVEGNWIVLEPAAHRP